jgi:multicomponent K+:H+ antiporter subunit E
MLVSLQLPKVRVRRTGTLLRLLGIVLVDVIRSNIAVGGIILGLGRRQRTPGFVNIALKLRNPYGLAALACIITATPGTLWLNFDAGDGVLTIHVLDLVDESEWISTIKTRYERHLLEIFQ